jgi:phage protein D
MMPAKRNPHSIVIIAGRRFDSWVDKQLTKRVSVELATDMASEASFTCFDPRFRILDSFTSGDGVPLLPMQFYMGFGQDLGPPVFEGYLQRVEHGDSDSTFIARDAGIKMRRELKSEYHQNMHDLAIIKKLATRNGLAFEGPDQAPQLEIHPSMPQDWRNDWEHTMERARASSFVIFVRHNTLYCKEPAKITEPILTLRFRKEFWPLWGHSLTYKLPENQQGRPKIAIVHARGRGGKRLEGKSKEHPRGHIMRKGAARDKAEHTKLYADRRAHAHKELQREPAFRLHVLSIPPLPGLRPDVRNTIQLENLGKLFSGPYLCDKVKHEHDGGGKFDTEYDLYRDIGA